MTKPSILNCNNSINSINSNICPTANVNAAANAATKWLLRLYQTADWGYG